MEPWKTSFINWATPQAIKIIILLGFCLQCGNILFQWDWINGQIIWHTHLKGRSLEPHEFNVLCLPDPEIIMTKIKFEQKCPRRNCSGMDCILNFTRFWTKAKYAIICLTTVYLPTVQKIRNNVCGVQHWSGMQYTALFFLMSWACMNWGFDKENKWEKNIEISHKQELKQ